MKPGMKMLMMANRSGDGKRSGGTESGYRGGREYEAARYEYNDNGADMNYGGMANRFHDHKGQGYYDDGRRAPRNAYSEPYGNYGMDRRYSADEYRPTQMTESMDKDEMYRDYKPDMDHSRMDEMSRRTSPMPAGHARGGADMKMTREMADEWMAGLQNEDGTKGPHWTLEQVKQIMAQKGVSSIDPLCMWAVMNMMYSDYCKVFKKYGVGDKLDFFVDISKSFIEDKDAGEGKVANYFHNIVKH